MFCVRTKKKKRKNGERERKRSARSASEANRTLSSPDRAQFAPLVDCLLSRSPFFFERQKGARSQATNWVIW